MRTIQQFFWVLVVAASILFAACATTKITSGWKDETYQGHPARIMVICVSSTPSVRRPLEEEFVKELKDRETDAIASYTVLPAQSLADKSAIDAKAREAGADAVLVTKSVGRKTGSSESAWVTYVDEYIDSETNIYDMKSGKRIWTASAETWINENVSQKTRIQSFVKIIVRRLSEQKVIKPVPVASEVKPY